MIGYVYLTTNKVNGMKYTGKHESEVFDPYYKGSGVRLIEAIKEFGWDNF